MLYKIINNSLINNSLKNIIFILIILFSFTLSSQKKANNKLESPIDFPIILSGNFGELRSSGFHSGIDIKTKGKEGIEIRSIDSGYVSRVQVSTSGFGKVVYIDHGNNLTTVYAHLSKFSDKIEKIINELQYKKKNYEVRKFFKSKELKIEKKEIIGLSGNTGSSFGPHLHFEIRKTNEELPINPLFYNFNVVDTIRPYLKNFFLYGIKNGLLRKKQLKLSKVNDSIFTATTIKTTDTIGFGIVSYDRQNKTNNIFGNYKYSLYKNDTLNFQLIFDSFTFSEKPFQKKYIDNEYYVLNKSRIVKLFGDNKKSLSFVKGKNEGLIINKGDRHNITVKLSDYDNNNTYIKLKIVGDSTNFKYDEEVEIPFNKLIDNEKKYNLSYNGHELIIEKNTFDRKSKILYKYENDTLYAYNPFLIALKNFEIKYPTKSLNDGQYLARINYDGSKNFVTNTLIDGYYQFKTKTLGNFYIDIDSLPPTIIRSKRVNYKNQIQYYINDKETGIKNYKGKINDQWALFEYEPKLKKIFFKNDTLLKLNKMNKVEIYVEDLVGNSTSVIDSLKF